MPSPINITAILLVNVMGIAILFVVAVANSWRAKEVSEENRCLILMFVSCLINCIVDPICFLADGKPGLFNRILVIGCNTLLYFFGLVVALAWVFLVASRLKTYLSPLHKGILCGIFIVATAMLILNLFLPVVFIADENNVYARLFGYWIHQSCYAVLIVDGLMIYLQQRYASGGLKFFPAWAFVIPATFGIALQAMFYGISTATPFTTVSIVCVILCLQNEFMQRDKLTGLYNRFYLNTVEKLLMRNAKLNYSAIMLDINGFKTINDTYGHKTGDEALIRLGNVLSRAVGRIGEVVRYAGDEFIIVLNTQDEVLIQRIIDRINELLDKCNREDNAPYQLSVAFGYCKLNLRENTMNAYMDTIDELMYTNKQEYYRTHKRYDRHINKTEQ